MDNRILRANRYTFLKLTARFVDYKNTYPWLDGIDGTFVYAQTARIAAIDYHVSHYGFAILCEGITTRPPRLLCYHFVFQGSGVWVFYS